MSVSPVDPLQEARWYLDKGSDSNNPRNAGNFGLPEYADAVQSEVRRRRRMLLGRNPSLALNEDSTDALLRNTVTGRLGRARSNSTATALGQAFDPTRPLGRDTLLGE